MDENYNATFHIPTKAPLEVADAEIVHAVSINRDTPIEVFGGVTSKNENLAIYNELSAVSEEVIKCRQDALANIY